jgi:hypothetical protein
MEKELQQKEREVEEGRRLLEEFAERRRTRGVTAGGDSGDELPHEVVKSLEEKKRAKLLRKGTSSTKLAVSPLSCIPSLLLRHADN